LIFKWQKGEKMPSKKTILNDLKIIRKNKKAM